MAVASWDGLRSVRRDWPSRRTRETMLQTRWNESRRSLYIVSAGPRFLGPGAGRFGRAALSSRRARGNAAQAKALPGHTNWV